MLTITPTQKATERGLFRAKTNYKKNSAAESSAAAECITDTENNAAAMANAAAISP